MQVVVESIPCRRDISAKKKPAMTTDRATGSDCEKKHNQNMVKEV